MLLPASLCCSSIRRTPWQLAYKSRKGPSLNRDAGLQAKQRSATVPAAEFPEHEGRNMEDLIEVDCPVPQSRSCHARSDPFPANCLDCCFEAVHLTLGPGSVEKGNFAGLVCPLTRAMPEPAGRAEHGRQRSRRGAQRRRRAGRQRHVAALPRGRGRPDPGGGAPWAEDARDVCILSTPLIDVVHVGLKSTTALVNHLALDSCRRQLGHKSCVLMASMLGKTTIWWLLCAGVSGGRGAGRGGGVVPGAHGSGGRRPRAGTPPLAVRR